jgi:hypothetical protein
LTRKCSSDICNSSVDSKRWVDRLNLLVFLGLVRKVPRLVVRVGTGSVCVCSSIRRLYVLSVVEIIGMNLTSFSISVIDDHLIFRCEVSIHYLYLQYYNHYNIFCASISLHKVHSCGSFLEIFWKKNPRKNSTKMGRRTRKKSGDNVWKQKPPGEKNGNTNTKSDTATKSDTNNIPKNNNLPKTNAKTGINGKNSNSTKNATGGGGNNDWGTGPERRNSNWSTGSWGTTTNWGNSKLKVNADFLYHIIH